MSGKKSVNTKPLRSIAVASFVVVVAIGLFPLLGVGALAPYATTRSDGIVSSFQEPPTRSAPAAQAPSSSYGDLRGTDYTNGPLPPAPPTNRSYYVTSLNVNSAYSFGFNRGRADVNLSADKGYVVDSMIILAFGKPHVAQGRGFNCTGNFATLLPKSQGKGCRSDIKTYAQNVIFGYINGVGQGTSHLNLVMGVNNTDDMGENYTYETYPHEAAGRDWAELMGEMLNYVNGTGYSSNATVYGGNDIETGPSVGDEVGYEAPNLTRLWLRGYNSTPNKIPVFDFGDSGGCPANDYSGNALCNSLWYQKDVRDVSMTGLSGAIPEIYARPPGTNRNLDMLISENASAWEQIALYDYDQQMRTTGTYNPPYIVGSLTQYAQCRARGCKGLTDNQPSDGWTYLFKALNDVDVVFVPNDRQKVARMSQSVLFALDIADADVP